jgi:5'-3' exonuclease
VGKFIQNLDQKQLFIKHAEQLFYILKPLYDALNIEWKLPPKIYENVNFQWEKINKVWKKIEEEHKKAALLSKDERIKIIRGHFDPRK